MVAQGPGNQSRTPIDRESASRQARETGLHGLAPEAAFLLLLHVARAVVMELRERSKSRAANLHVFPPGL